MTQESNSSESIILFNNGDQVLSTHFWEEYLVHKNENNYEYYACFYNTIIHMRTTSYIHIAGIIALCV